jgi:hypothetical protein
MQKLRVSFLCLICSILVSTSATHAGSAYQHDRFATKPTDIVRQFEAYIRYSFVVYGNAVAIKHRVESRAWVDAPEKSGSPGHSDSSRRADSLQKS